MARRLPSLNALRAFEAAARHGTLTQAADELCVTPSAVGHQVKILEAWLGLRLFATDGRVRSLTAQGRQLAAEIGGALDRMDHGCRALRRRSGAAELRVSVTPTFAIRWLVPRLGRFQAAHPGISVQITIGFHTRDFQRDGADVALRFGPPDWPGFAADLLFKEDIFPVCHPRLLDGPHALTSPPALRHHTLLHTLHGRDHWGRWLAAAGVPQSEVDPDVGPVFEMTTLALDQAEAGLGVAISREAQVAELLESGRLAAPFRRDLLRGGGCYMLTLPERRDETPVRAFHAWLMEEAESDRSDDARRPGLPPQETRVS
jgi:LysR family glycine cleavage system transcriptional activator